MNRLTIIAAACLIGSTAAHAKKQCAEDQFLRGNKCYNSLGDIPGRTRVEAGSKGDDITCSGTLIDVDVKPGAVWPLAVVYDIEGRRACVIDRLNAGHDPLRGACNVGEGCTVSGIIGRKIGETYFLDRWDAKAPAGSPPGLEVPSGK